MPGSRRGLVAPQNTFLDSIIRRSNGQHSSFILANARIVDYPIVYCSDGFCKLSGYNRAEVMQKNSSCNFMHGELTDKETLKKVYTAFEEMTQEQVEILLYKKNRTPLWLLLHVAPIKNEKDAVVLFLCTFKDITALKQPIEDDGGKGMAGLSKFARLARSITRNRSVLLQFSSQVPTTKVDNAKLNNISNMMNMNSDYLPQYRLEAPKTPAHIILHYCAFKTTWDWMILILTFYTAVMVPLNIAFKNKTIEELSLIVIDSIVDVIFFIDIILNYHTTFVGQDGEVVSDPKIIRMNYLKSWFLVDLLSCLPYDVFNAFQHNNDSISSLFSALKVVRLLRMGRVIRKLDHYLEYVAAMLLLLICFFILIAHWFACAWYGIGFLELDKNVHYGWLTILANETGLTLTNAEDKGIPKDSSYVTALYYTLSCMTSVGFGNVAANTNYEKAFSIVLMIIGSLLYATIFGNVATIFNQLYSTTARYHEMLNSVRDFMKLHDVPTTLSERVMDYIVSTWAITRGIDTTKVLNYCPKDMKADICVHLNRKVFNEHPAFRLASDGCLRSLAMHFSIGHSAPGDLLFHQGESLDSLCFIVSGSLEVIQDEEVVAILSRGDVFGDTFWKEPALGQSAANVRALTYCDLHIIKRDRLLEVLDFYHAFANSFARNLVLTYNLRHRMIFRTVVDVKRERELAEKRKNDPPLDLSSDHPVRKLISKFRKISDAKALTQNGGTDGSQTDLERSNHVPNNTTDVTVNIEPNEVQGQLSNAVENEKPQKQMTSKWGRFLAQASTEDKAETPKSSIEMTPMETPSVSTPSSSNGGGGSGLASRPSNNRPMSKWSRMLNNRQETIEEAAEEEEKTNLRKTESTDSGILRSDQKLDDESERKPSNVDKDYVLSTLCDIKLEIKEEIELLNHKMNRIDEQIGDILRLFSSEAAKPQHSMPSSRGNSSSRDSSESSGPSPKNSLPSSPHRSSLDAPPARHGGSSGSAVSASGVAPIITPDPMRRSSATSHRAQTPPSNSSSGRTTPSDQGSNRLRTKIIKGRKRQIQPQDDSYDEINQNDRDLDIL